MTRPTFFYGYTIVISCFIIQAIGIGTYIAFGVFFKPLLADFGWSRATLSGAHSLALIIAGFLGILVGRLNDRFGPRVVMTVTGFFFGLGFLLMSGLNNVWQLYLFYGVLVGIGLSSIDVIALTTTARWFVRRRGMMTGIVKVGTGVGLLVMPLVASILIAGSGWRTSYIVFGATVMVLLIAIGQLLRRDPARVGLLPDGNRETQTAKSNLAETGFYLHEALRTRQFWTICFAYLATMFCVLIIMVHIVPHATDAGISSTTAAGILSTIGGISMGGAVCHRHCYRPYRQQALHDYLFNPVYIGAAVATNGKRTLDALPLCRSLWFCSRWITHGGFTYRCRVLRAPFARCPLWHRLLQ